MLRRLADVQVIRAPAAHVAAAATPRVPTTTIPPALDQESGERRLVAFWMKRLAAAAQQRGEPLEVVEQSQLPGRVIPAAVAQPSGLGSGRVDLASSIRWWSCGGAARLRASSGPKITLAVIRHRASRPGNPIGTPFFNPGGPGVSGVQDHVSWPRVRGVEPGGYWLLVSQPNCGPH